MHIPSPPVSMWSMNPYKERGNTSTMPSFLREQELTHQSDDKGLFVSIAISIYEYSESAVAPDIVGTHLRWLFMKRYISMAA